MTDPVPFQITNYGFIYGAGEITRIHSNSKTGQVILELKTSKENIQITINKTGKIKIHNSKGEEWKKEIKNDH